jgi:hypothetical protein
MFYFEYQENKNDLPLINEEESSFRVTYLSKFEKEQIYS